MASLKVCICLMCLLLLSLVLTGTGQAPGDEAELCTVTLPGVGRNVFVDPPNEVPLMDTSHYRFLITPGNGPEPVWQSLDLDDNNAAGQHTAWSEQGSVCQSQVIVCGYLAGSQNNWLITQHINTTLDNGDRLQQVTMQVTYTQAGCPEGGANACQRVFDVYKYETSKIDPVTARNTSYYTRVGGLTTNQGQQEQTGSLNIDLSTNESGFYLAIVDTGTCIVISRVAVFYYICPNETVNLVAHPRTLAPPVGTPPLQGVPADCVENARPASGGSLALTCLSQGKWLDSMRGCVCDPGFTPSQTIQCNACPVGTYRSSDDPQSVCNPCPMNTVTDAVGAGVCECLPGYFRDEQTNEGPEVDCTAPCGPVRDLQAATITDTIVTVRWTRPEVTGRDGFYYTLQYSDPDNIGAFLPTPPLRIDNQALSVSYTIRGLRPNTPYTIRVTSHNEVTDQDPENAALRIVDIQVQTMDSEESTLLPTSPSTMSTPVTCPEVTCPPVEPCPTCSSETCPPPPACPTMNPTAGPSLKFILRGITYLNNSVMAWREIRERDNALLCVTDNVDCCSASSGGEFYYPDGSKVQVRAARRSLYRNRREQVIRLNRRANSFPRGRYKCEIPDARGVMQSLYVNIL